MSQRSMTLLAISGSLRAQSSNTRLLQAAAALAPSGMHFTFYEGLGSLPHFNPEFDTDTPHPAVAELRERLKQADGVIICTPEYAAGVPGSLKNALDWIVSSGEFKDKPVSVISASPNPLGGDKAFASLLLTLNMMSAKVVENATLTIPMITIKLNAAGEITDAATSDSLRDVLQALAEAIPD